ncbi:MAG: 1-acyl-sn-glycerol-3-phosphate acyltransferase [Planctomycetes bacterium]|nr:1-acyl-sn-glycerol-3-phosphate acyltransferase [Planctomycetota bacterium]
MPNKTPNETPSPPQSAPPNRPPNLAFYRTAQAVLRGLGCIWWRVHAEGMERIPATGPVIFASTHESFLDPPIVGAYVKRHIWYMARRSLFFSGKERSRFRTWVGSLCGMIEVDRDGTGLGALRGAETKLREGNAVLIFPEGTRSEGGEVQEFRAGVGLLAKRTGAQVVPVSLDGTRRVWPRGAKVPSLRAGPVRLIYGAPVTYGEASDAKEVSADIRRRILELRLGSVAPVAT